MQRPLMRKKKKKTRWGRLLIFTFAMLAVVASVRYEERVMAAWHEVRRVIWKPDVAAVMHALKREAAGIYCVGMDASCYVFDREGIIFDAARTVVGDVIVTIYDMSDFKPAFNQPFLGQNEWRNLFFIIASIQNNKLNADKIIFNRAQGEADVILLPERVPAHFSLAFDPREHVDALPELRKKISFKELRYLDMRIEGRIFYR